MGLFVTFEGIDGAGKSTQIERLRHRLETSGHAVVTTREPGGTALGDILREILLDPNQMNLAQTTEALLYATSRAQLVHEVIIPSLEAGKMVLCDRFVDASIAYQGAGLSLGTGVVRDINLFATGGKMPDLTFLFDLAVSTSRERVLNSRQGTDPDRIEVRNDAYFNRVRGEFLRIAEQDPTRVVVVSAEQTPDALEEEIWNHVSKRIHA